MRDLTESGHSSDWIVIVYAIWALALGVLLAEVLDV